MRPHMTSTRLQSSLSRNLHQKRCCSLLSPAPLAENPLMVREGSSDPTRVIEDAVRTSVGEFVLRHRSALPAPRRSPRTSSGSSFSPCPTASGGPTCCTAHTSSHGCGGRQRGPRLRRSARWGWWIGLLLEVDHPPQQLQWVLEPGWQHRQTKVAADLPLRLLQRRTATEGQQRLRRQWRHHHDV